jgi:hypothetical protein
VGEFDVAVRVERRDGGWLVRSSAGGVTLEARLAPTAGLPAIETYSQVRR